VSRVTRRVAPRYDSSGQSLFARNVEATEEWYHRYFDWSSAKVWKRADYKCRIKRWLNYEARRRSWYHPYNAQSVSNSRILRHCDETKNSGRFYGPIQSRFKLETYSSRVRLILIDNIAISPSRCNLVSQRGPSVWILSLRSVAQSKADGNPPPFRGIIERTCLSPASSKLLLVNRIIWTGKGSRKIRVT